ncbi:DUF4199 domain-containing protein [Viscerimonas tarda]
MKISKKKIRLLLKYAMNYGVILGAFWVFKYLFLILSNVLQTVMRDSFLPDFLLYLHLYLLPIGTLSLFYVLLRRYRDYALKGKISYLQCLAFGALLFTFAALIEAVVIYVHYKFIDPKYIYIRDKGWLEMLLQYFFSHQWLETQRDTFGNIIVLISEIVKNIVIGFFLSVIYGIFVRRSDSNKAA